jgi:hypothetical protein
MKHVCPKCVGDQVLAEWIASNGEPAPCSYGHGHTTSIEMQRLAERVGPIYLEWYEPGDWIMVPLPDELGDHDHKQLGDGPDQILGEMLWAEPGLVEDLLSELANLYESSRGDPAESMFEIGQNYVFVDAASPIVHHDTWEEFSDRSRHARRFLDSSSLESLGSILGTSETGPLPDLAVREVTAEDDLTIFRGRLALDREEAITFLARPSKELGPPPASRATAGRMNPAGIPVFYGALSEATCVAELRPWVSGRVVTAAYHAIGPLSLLDLGALSTSGGVSFFAENFGERLSHRRFLLDFEEIVSRPVQPHESDVEFVPTQIVAEYVRDTLNLDGILYRSSQGENLAPNVVLFTENDTSSSLSLDKTAVRVWGIEAIDYSISQDFDLDLSDVAEVVQGLAVLSSEWNTNQIAAIVTIFDDAEMFATRVFRLWGAVRMQQSVLARMTVLLSQSSDEGFQQRLAPIVDNYRGRFEALKSLFAAFVAQDPTLIDLAMQEYTSYSDPTVVLPLVVDFQNYPRTQPLFDTLGFNLADLLAGVVEEE